MKVQSSENKLVITEEFIFDQNKLPLDPNNHFNVQSILHGLVSLAGVNHIYVFYEVINDCKKSIDSLKACFENVNIVS